MATRYELFDQLADLCKFVFEKPYKYKKMIQSGELKEVHSDYGRGYYDLHIWVYEHKGQCYCRTCFATVDDGDFGSVNECRSKKDAKELVDKLKERFDEMVSCHSHEELNKEFQDLGVYFTWC